MLNEVFCCMAYAMSATVFYKKSFKREQIFLVLIFLQLGISLDWISNLLLGSVATFICMYLLTKCSNNDEENWIKTVKFDVFIFFLLAAMDAKFQIAESALPYWTSMRIYLVAFPQFLRKPIWLKTRLQDLRSKLGPVFVLYTVLYALGPHRTPLGEVAGAAAFLAGIVFRPDNGAILELLGYTTKLHERRYYHGRLMIVSLVLTCINMSIL